MVSEVEAVKRERAAFFAGSAWQNSYEATARRQARELNPESKLLGRHCGADVRDEAAREYPLPKISRPRVVYRGDFAWKVEDGRFWFRLGESGDWHGIVFGPVTVKLVHFWNDLAANPTEEVEAE